MNRIEELEKELKGLRKELANHALYKNLKTPEDIKTFMEYHVFAVWDFMSLLKALQLKLSNVSVPWIPNSNTKLTRLINEIVLVEESDLNETGLPQSHFEMYLDAMKEIGANTNCVHELINLLCYQVPVNKSIESLELDYRVKKHLGTTFSIIRTDQLHYITAAFTYGREDVIPSIFIQIVDGISQNNPSESLDKLMYYLQRHIEVDSDEHGPICKKMLIEICEEDDSKWDQVKAISKQCLEARIELWDAILEKIRKN